MTIKEKEDMKMCLDYLLEFVEEEVVEGYYRSDRIAEVLDVYKKYFD